MIRPSTGRGIASENPAAKRDPQPLSADSDRATHCGREILGGVVALAAALGLAALLYHLQRQEPRLAALTGGLFVLLIPAVYLLALRGRAQLNHLLAVTLAAVCVALMGWYFSWVVSWVTLPADIWIWSESEFVQDIVKFRAGYPLYTPDVNNESFIYPPGSQLVTYFLALLFLHPTSIPLYRGIQVGYTVIAAFIAFLCVRRLLVLAEARRAPAGFLWGAFAMPALFLIATNTTANWFVHLLHNDALAQLLTAAGFYLLVRYAQTRSVGVLASMAVLPAAGFLVKQSVLIWGGLYTGYLVFFDRPRCWKRIVAFAAAWCGIFASVLGACWLLWREPFFFWTFTVIKQHSVSVRRALEHGMAAWPFLLVGLVGAFFLVRGPHRGRLAGLWLTWLVVWSTEVYTSGLGWMMNHIGPGTLLAGVWGIAALATARPLRMAAALQGVHQQPLMRGVLLGAVGVVWLCGLGATGFSRQHYPQQAKRYVREIEREFEGEDARAVLLDAGSWIYLKHGIVMKDRVIGIGDRANGGIGDFSGILQRIRDKQYSKILVRNLHKADFWYDHYSWKRPIGVRQALLENYREVRRIASAVPEGFIDRGGTSVLLSTISVLVPRRATEPSQPRSSADNP